MRRLSTNKKVNIYGEAISFITRYSDGIPTISTLVKRLQSFGSITELCHYINGSMIAGGNHAHTKKEGDSNE